MSARDRGASTEAGTALDTEGPLRRWARRKREVARGEEAEHEARRRGDPPDASEAAGEARAPAGDAPEPAVVEEKVLTDEDMPALDSLDENSDYSGFLSSGVSEALRRRALRKLFSSAVFNIPDGLDDYDDDFTSFAALGDIVTSDMKHQAKMEAERAKQAQARAEPATGIEEEPSEPEDEPPATASDDATARADALPAGATEPPGPAACAEVVPPDAVADEDASGNGERSASPTSAGRGSGESVSDGGAPADVQALGEAGTTGSASGGASDTGASAAPAGRSETGLQASAGSEAPAKTGRARHRGA